MKRIPLSLLLLASMITLPIAARCFDIHVGEMVYVDCSLVHEVNLRSSPKTFNVIRALKCNEAVTVLRREGAYFNVHTADDAEGYISVVLVSVNKQSVHAPAMAHTAQKPKEKTATNTSSVRATQAGRDAV